MFMKTENCFLSKAEQAGEIDQHRPSEKSFAIFFASL